jgi:chemotaxis protein histidine kinase CheA
MAKEQPIELFMPPNMLKAKVGGTIGGLDTAAILRAEAAVETLKEDFADWVAGDVERLSRCRDRFAARRNDHTIGELFRAAHDIKGQAASFDFALISRVAASLCKLIDATAAPDALPLVLVDAHVTAIRIIFRDKIRNENDRKAVELIEELEARTDEITEPAA